MKTNRFKLAPLLALACLFGNLTAQNEPGFKFEPKGPNEDKPVIIDEGRGNQPVKKEELRLTGEWEVFFGGKPSGIYLDLRQISFRVHGNYGDIKPNKKLDIHKGQEFFRASIQGNIGKGEILLRKLNKDTKALEKEMSPFRFKILDEGERLDCEIGGDKIKKEASKFELRRIARVKSFRLLVKTPDGFQPANKIIQDMPMAIEAELSSPSKKKFPITLKSGATTLKLDASYVPRKESKGDVFKLAARTPLFLPTFGNQFGVEESDKKKAKEEFGRAPTEEDWKSLEGIWRAGYIDKELGEVNGWAEFKPGGRTKFSYQHPENEYWSELSLAKVGILEGSDEKMKRKWKFKFEGRGVVGEKVEPTKKEELKQLLLPTNVPPVEITHEKLKASLEVERAEWADYDTVFLELNQQPSEGLMIFDWRYTASRETERDRLGFGRVGSLEVEEPNSRVGTMRGREAWMKNSPNILASFCTEDQTGYIKTPLYDYPVPRYRYGTNKQKVVKNGKLQDETIDANKGIRREVFIVATDIPENVDQPIRLKADESSGVSFYKVIAKGPEGKLTNSDALKKAWQTYRESQKAAADNGSKKASSSGELEKLSQSPPMGILVHAMLKDKADPGIQMFTLNDIAGEWNLQFGDTVAQPQWLRRIAIGETGEASEWEQVAVAFRPETVRIALVSKQAIKAEEEIMAMLMVGSKRVEYNKDSQGKPNYKIPLKPDPNEKNRYVSPPINLISKQGLAKAKEANPSGFFVVCDKDDFITAQFQPRTRYTIAPRSAKLKVAITPDSMNALWKAALKKAADAAGQPIDDWDAVARGEAEEVTNYILTNLVIPGESVERSLKIRIGDHAAMLLLRDVFVEMMNEQLADWRRNQSPKKISAIFRGQRTAIAGRRSPLSYYKIPLQKLPQFRGTKHDDEIYLYQIFDDFDMKRDYGFKGVQYSLEESAFTYAWKNYGADMQKSINDAASLKVADVRGLLELTGYSFQPIVVRLLPRLMKLETNAAAQTNRWVPDRIARAYVKSLETIGAAVKAQEEYSKADTSFVLTAASLVTIPLGNVGGFWSAMAVAGMSAVEVGHAVYDDISTQWGIDDDIKDEVAKGAVLGVDRAAKKQSEKLAMWQRGLAVGGAALGGIADGASALKALKGLKSAEVLAAGAEIMKRADIADPTVLRQLSKADQAVLKRIADEASELAKAGKTAELTDLQKAALNQAQELDVIFKNDAIKEINNLKPKELAERAAEVSKKAGLDDLDGLKNLDEADLTALKRVRDEAEKLRAAGKADDLTDLQKQALKHGENIDEAYAGTPKGALKKKIADRFAEASKPVSKEELAETATKLEKTANDLDEVGKQAKKQVNDLKKSYEEATEAARKSPSPKATEDLRKARTAYKEAKKNSEVVNDLVGDLKQRTTAAKKLASEAEAGKKVRLTAADKRMLNLKGGRKDLDKFIKSQKQNPTAAAYSKQQRDMMRKLSGLKKSDVDLVEDLVKANGGDWSDISKLAGGNGNDVLNAHRVAAYRRLKMNKLADEAMGETKKFMRNAGVDEMDIASLERNAFGSANLTSDYDVAIKGAGAELAVQNFNQKVRKLFKGTESGAVVDTNLYTDPVYNIFKQADMEGKIGNLSAKQVDKARQFVFQQMANAKYRILGNADDAASMAQWNKFKKNVLDGVPPSARKSMEDMMDQAVGARNLAEKRIADKLANVADSAKNVDGNAKLRVTNELYGDTLTDIHHYRRMMDDLDAVKNGTKDIRDINLPPALHKPEFAGQLNEIKKLLDNDATKARGLAEIDELKRQGAINIRSKQGEALYYASEAYQTRGTIGHVVDELQAGGQKVTVDSLKAGRNTDAVKNSKLTRDDYVNSFYENGGNLMKELNAKHVLSNDGTLKGGLDGYKYNKAGQKVAKYFERQLDAAAKAGVDMDALFKANPELEKLANATIELNKVRSDPGDFAEVAKNLFKGSNNAEEAFVKQALAFNDLLEGKVIRNSEILSYANKLSDAEKAVAKKAVKFGSTWEPNVFATGKGMQFARAISDNLGKANDDFNNRQKDEMSLLAGKERLNGQLSADEVKRLQSFRKQARSMRELNTQAAAARASGVSSKQLDDIIDKAKQSAPNNWQAAAATEVNNALKKKANTTTTERMTSGDMSPFLRDRLGLPKGIDATNAADLSNQLKKSGKFIQPSTKPRSLSELASQAEAGRKAIVMVRDADGKPTWKELRGISTDSAGRKLVRIRDAASGAEFKMPEALFNARSNNANHQIVVDPFRNADGNITLKED